MSDEGNAWQPKAVLKDAFHWMNQLELPKNWARRQDCMRELSDALFVENKFDREAVERVLVDEKKTTFSKQRAENEDWLWPHIRCKIPPPPQLMPQLQRWFNRWRDHKDDDGNPIFNAERQKAWGNMLKMAESGGLSDYPGVQLYFPRGKDTYGLQQYYCARGTSKNEAHHGQLFDHLATENNGVELTHAKLGHKLFEINVDAERRHVPNTPNFGHYNLPLIDQQNAFQEYLFGEPLHPNHRNVMQYKVTAGGTTGVVPVFDDDISPSLVEGEPWKLYTGDRKFMSEMTGKIPFLPVATDEERALYRSLVDQHISTAGQKPDFNRFAQTWDTKVDGVKIFRKLPCHLEEHHKDYLVQIRCRNERRQEASEGRTTSDLLTIAEETGPEPVPYTEPERNIDTNDAAAMHIPVIALGTHSEPRAKTSTLDPAFKHAPATSKGKKPRTCSTCRAHGKHDDALLCRGRGGHNLCPINAAKGTPAQSPGTTPPPQQKRPRTKSPPSTAPRASQGASYRPLLPLPPLHMRVYYPGSRGHSPAPFM